jgi:hypothetical protein
MSIASMHEFSAKGGDSKVLGAVSRVVGRLGLNYFSSRVLDMI